MDESAYPWTPIRAPGDATKLELIEMRALERLWKGQRERLKQQGAWEPFWERMARSWSVETGVIEGVFEVSKGVTTALVEQGFAPSLVRHGEADRSADEIIGVLNDHRAAITMVTDLVEAGRDLSVAWIKELHALLCSHQGAADAVDPFGQRVKVLLARGAFKARPNTVTLPNGSKHEYCPPDQVASEMERLVAIYHDLPSALPEVRAAWIHHAFDQIHPFEDGNGRVARALASIDFIRAGLFPLLIDRGDRDASYLPAVRRAERGDLGALVRFFFERQERVVRRAISEAELAVTPRDSLAAAIGAAKSKLARRESEAKEVRELVSGRFGALKQRALDHFERTASTIRAEVPGASASVQKSNEGTAHYFKAQIIDQATRSSYWADLRNPWEWVRLRLIAGGVTDVVIVLHFVGNPSPGVATAIAFVGHRADKTERALEDAEPFEIDPLVLYPDEDTAPQAERFEQWLSGVEREAVALWVRYL